MSTDLVIDAESTEIEPPIAAMPIQTPEAALAAWNAYVAMCEAILTKDDYQEYPQWDKEAGTYIMRRFKKKSAVKKLQTRWGISVTAPDAIRDDLGGGTYGFRVRAIATDPRGRVVEAWGGCSTQEEKYAIARKKNENDWEYAERQRKALARSYHDILATAETRATNRAAMNCIGVGGGEVTWEEVDKWKKPPLPDKPKTSTEDPEAKRRREIIMPLFRELAKLNPEKFEKYVKDIGDQKAEEVRHQFYQDTFKKTKPHRLSQLSEEQFERLRRSLEHQRDNLRGSETEAPTD